jgi:hypothetical protein
MKRAFLALLLMPLAGAAQHRFASIDFVDSPPDGLACSTGNALVQYRVTGDIYVCDPALLTYRLLTGSGSSNGNGGGSGATSMLQGTAVTATSPTDQQFLQYIGADAQAEWKSIEFPGVGNCGTNQFVNSLAQNSAPFCARVQYSDLGGTVPTWNQNTTGTAAGLTGTPNVVLGTVNATTGAFTGTLSTSAAGGIQASGGPVNTSTSYQIGGTTVLSQSNTLPATCSKGDTWGNVSLSGIDNGLALCIATNTWVYLPDSNKITGYCPGNATAGASVSLGGLGGSAGNCTTGVTNGAGVIMPKAYTIVGMWTACGTDTLASNATFTLLYTPVNTTTAPATTGVSISYGTTAGALASTSTTFTGSAGDRIYLQLATPASGTIGNCSATVAWR